MTRSLMIQGTGSGAGKSLIAAAFCRILSDEGLRVAPFKAQNMALNAYITRDGGEIGNAQALQAEAARVEPSVDMNPVLLKTMGERGSQVILRGKVLSTMKAAEYYAFRDEAWKTVAASYAALAKGHDAIVIEGAGSPAEINLMDVDIVNMAMARHAKAPVLLVGDIDKGGVFASLYGTVKLLGREARHIKGFIINKFRGDMAILDPGLSMIRDRTGIPVIGVMPYLDTSSLPEEDGLAMRHGRRNGSGRDLRVVVVRVGTISNFTDFDALAYEPDTGVLFSDNPADIETADIVILPGSKNTVKDLLCLRERGIDTAISRAAQRGVAVIGICGGYQMLGKTLFDPEGVESDHRIVEGIGLLDIETTFGREKATFRTEAVINGKWKMENGKSEIENILHLPSSSNLPSSIFHFPLSSSPSSIFHLPLSSPLSCYEIHMGTSSGDIGLFTLRRMPGGDEMADGSVKGSCWGTYLHGIFDNDAFRRAVLNKARMRKGLAAIETPVSFQAIRDRAIDALADAVRSHLDLRFVKEVMGL